MRTSLYSALQINTFYDTITKKHSPGSARRQAWNGSPWNPLGQLHTATWLTVSQLAPDPQAPEQGLTHLPSLQARSPRHSMLSKHSALEQYERGFPLYPEGHEQTGRPPASLHMALVPQGLFEQGDSVAKQQLKLVN